ncbi:hypothetical protein IW261DRAFT_1511783 [Armillaria novae-zelandiae]|uniref:Mid2 domain-containing protein n=1 Tax=Armillaria novae-zelandiae TaxID=153914 RepID=A0AA39NTE2_9AGAR|nr:hypothetical protein IW261DRAFT_1511783 [Armillaria novae-zelandiae]
MSLGPFRAISVLSVASISFALQIRLPDEKHVPGQNVTVILIHEEGDPPDVLLKKLHPIHNKTSNNVVNVPNFMADAKINITFAQNDKYQILAFGNDSKNHSSPTPIASSSVFEVNDNNKGHPHHGSDKGLIVGAVLGSVALVVIVLLTVYTILFRSRRRRRFQDRLVRHSDTPASSFVQYLYAKYPPHRNIGRTNPGDSPPPVYISPSRTSACTSLGHSMGTMSVSSSTTSFGQKPLTDRQMDIQGRLHSLQEKLLKLEGASWRGQGDIEAAENDAEILDTKAKTGTLKDFMESPWALNATDVVPSELVHCFTSY